MPGGALPRVTAHARRARAPPACACLARAHPARARCLHARCRADLHVRVAAACTGARPARARTPSTRTPGARADYTPATALTCLRARAPIAGCDALLPVFGAVVA